MNNTDELNKLKQSATNAAQLLKMLAHPDRLLILCQLVEQERCVAELMENTSLSQSAFSQHLSVLRQHQLVSTRKQAQKVYYHISDSNVLRILETLHGIYCA